MRCLRGNVRSPSTAADQAAGASAAAAGDGEVGGGPAHTVCRTAWPLALTPRAKPHSRSQSLRAVPRTAPYAEQRCLWRAPVPLLGAQLSQWLCQHLQDVLAPEHGCTQGRRHNPTGERHLAPPVCGALCRCRAAGSTAGWRPSHAPGCPQPATSSNIHSSLCFSTGAGVSAG